MASPKLPDHILQEAVDLVTLHGSPHLAFVATGIPRATLADRCRMAAHRGILPATPGQASATHLASPAAVHTGQASATHLASPAAVHTGHAARFPRPKRGRTHLVIPDVQAKPGVPNEHMGWIAAWALEHRPDVIVQIGDWFDMPSLSSYDKGKRGYEGRRYVDDIDAGHASIEAFEKPIEDHNRTHPEDTYCPSEKHVTGGNHENRADRAADCDPMLYGRVGTVDMHFADYGWNFHPFLEVINLGGVSYSHYFTSGPMGRPVSSAAVLLRERMGSATMGHVQHTDIAIHKKTRHTALFSGICYLHDEVYLGPQGNSTRRQIVVKREVEDGVYDLELISLEALKKRYG